MGSRSNRRKKKANIEVEGALISSSLRGSKLKNNIQKVEDSILKVKVTEFYRDWANPFEQFFVILLHGKTDTVGDLPVLSAKPRREVSEQEVSLQSDFQGRWLLECVNLGETNRTLWDRIRKHMDWSNRQTESNCHMKHWGEVQSGKNTQKVQVKVM